VYVRNKSTGTVNIVRYGDPNMRIKKNIPARKKSFLARFGAILAKVRGQKSLSPAYWAIRSWR
jgi:NADPH-dependent glutamate synthase beta subunit-like oxidoreductase